MTAITIAIDCMGGDFGPSVMIPAAAAAIKKYPHLSLLLVGNSAQLESELNLLTELDRARLTVVNAAQTVSNSELPSQALRKKKDSSMAVALSSVSEGIAQACVSAGNTGALMAFSRYILKMIPGVIRPAITTAIPTMNGHTRILDLGANVDCSAQRLFQFALLGTAMANAVDNIDKPKVCILNIGSEVIKGNEQTKATAELLDKSPLIHYKGYIEGDAIYSGNADVIVCDGFVGNVLLKASEGVARMLAYRLQKEFRRNYWSRFLSLIAMTVLDSFRKRVNPDQYNGASFIGLQGIVIKSHGAANINATLAAIEEAINEVEHNVPAFIKTKFQQLESN